LEKEAQSWGQTTEIVARLLVQAEEAG